MKILLLPPYRGAGYDFRPDQEPYYQHVLEQMQGRGELDGTTIVIDPGAHTDFVSGNRDEELFAHLTVGVLNRFHELEDRTDIDAVVVLGAIDVGFHPVRKLASIPVAYPLHSAVHLASLLGDRFSIIDVTDPQAARARRLVRDYQLEQKLGTIRILGRTSTELSPILRQPPEVVSTSPEGRLILDQIHEQCCLAIEEDRADVLIIGFTPFQMLQDQVRSRLDSAGYADIPLVWVLSAAIAVARTMAALEVLPSGRAFPADALTAKPIYR